MERNSDFLIEDGVLVDYCGQGGDVRIPDGVTAIGVNAFRSCEGLRSVVIPAGVARIERDAFARCRALTHVCLPARFGDRLAAILGEEAAARIPLTLTE